MLVWTIQHQAVWDKLQTDGLYMAERALAAPNMLFDDFMSSFEWLMGQMISRIGEAPKPDLMPIWLWQKYQGEIGHPDRVSREIKEGYLRFGDPGVLIALDIPEKALLLSDFDAWHFVLNYWYVPASEAEETAFEDELEAQGLDQFNKKLMPVRYKEMIESSWERIFDHAWLKERTELISKQTDTQAVTWALKFEWVSYVEKFISLHR